MEFTASKRNTFVVSPGSVTSRFFVEHAANRAKPEVTEDAEGSDCRTQGKRALMPHVSSISALLTPTSALPSRKFFGPFSVFSFFNSQEHFIPGFLNLQDPGHFCVLLLHCSYLPELFSMYLFEIAAHYFPTELGLAQHDPLGQSGPGRVALGRCSF